MGLMESGEMYLETILILSKTRSAVRSVDVGDHMGYSKPSVSRAVGKLKKDGYINIDANGYITLTKPGLAVAEKIYERHTILAELLVRLGVDRETAVADACKVEHDISDKTFSAIKAHIEKYSKT